MNDNVNSGLKDKREISGAESPKTFETQSVPAENRSNGGGSAFLDSMRKISCINTEIAMKRVSGLEIMYRGTVEIFYKKLLSECERMDAFLKSKDLRNFSIVVHGLKSMLATIGAMELSEAAAAMEAESKSEKLGYCEERLPEFLSRLRKLYEQLSPIFQDKEDGSRKDDGDAELLKEKVEAALEAVEDFDDKPGLAALRELLRLNYGEKINEALKKAYNALKDFDYDAATSILNALRDMI